MGVDWTGIWEMILKVFLESVIEIVELGLFCCIVKSVSILYMWKTTSLGFGGKTNAQHASLKLNSTYANVDSWT